ncbi:MAG: TPR-repeat protein [Verrucomicrobiales bacterium]|nr:TPR-repeat protein [Verrucomicrobiales bacterium]
MNSKGELILQLLSRGLQSDLATKIAEIVPDMGSLAERDLKSFENDFTPAEVQFITRALKRREIPTITISRLVKECDWKCCICWKFDDQSSVIVHHIEEHSKTIDDTFGNLVLLCPNHHALAHSKWEITRSPCPPELIRLRKGEWIKAINDFKSGLRTAPGRESTIENYWRSSPPPGSPKFIGRTALIEDIVKTLSLPRKGVGLVGMGGIGKTALALKVSDKCLKDFPGGVFWADLSDENGEILPILKTWLSACGRPCEFSMDAKSAVSHFRAVLSSRIVEKGNCLFVIDDARETWLIKLRTLLESIPEGPRILLTTRDKTVPIALGLALQQVETLSDSEALELFYVETGTLIPELESTETLSLIHFLGSLPLAIILVGKQVALNSSKPGFSLKGLQQRIEGFAEEILSFPGHRGLAASFALSYESLNKDTKRIFRWLGVFATVSVKTKQVASLLATSPPETERGLDRMVAISLLDWGLDPSIYRIHPMLYQYARHLLSVNLEEFLEARGCHMRYFAEFVDLIAQNHPRNHDEIQAEYSNILTAFEGAFETYHWSLVSNLARSLWVQTEFLPTRGYERQAIDLLEKAVTASKKIDDDRMQFAHLGNLGAAQLRLGQFSKSKETLERALLLSQKKGDDFEIAPFLHNLGVLYRDMGDVEKAISFLSAALKRAKIENNPRIALNVIGTLGSVHRGCGRYAHAKEFYKLGLEWSRKVNDRLCEGNNLSNLGLVLCDVGELEEGEGYIKEALSIAVEISDKRGEANRLAHLGRLMMSKSNFSQNTAQRSLNLSQGRHLLTQALEITHEIGDRANEGNCVGDLGNCCRLAGQLQLAKEYFGEAIAIAREVGHLESEAIFCLNLGLVNRDLNEQTAARKNITHAVRIFQSTKSRNLPSALKALNSLSPG